MFYAITFDFDTSRLEHYYPGAYTNAYKEVRDELKKLGFEWKQGSVYFGNSSINAVTCVLAVQQLGQKFSWFTPSLKDIRMLRIEEYNDLLPALVQQRELTHASLEKNEIQNKTRKLF